MRLKKGSLVRNDEAGDSYLVLSVLKHHYAVLFIEVQGLGAGVDIPIHTINEDISKHTTIIQLSEKAMNKFINIYGYSNED